MAVQASVSQAKGQLNAPVRLAEAGEDVVLTRFGRAVVRLVPVPVRSKLSPAERQALIEQVQAEARLKATPGPSAARSQDFLYDGTGLPK